MAHYRWQLKSAPSAARLVLTTPLFRIFRDQPRTIAGRTGREVALEAAFKGVSDEPGQNQALEFSGAWWCIQGEENDRDSWGHTWMITAPAQRAETAYGYWEAILGQVRPRESGPRPEAALGRLAAPGPTGNW